MKEKVLVTGGTGRLGRAFQDYVKGKDICNRLHNIKFEFVFPKRKELDLTKEISIEPTSIYVEENITTIIHLAAFTGIPPCEKDKELAYKTNVEGTKKLIIECKKFNLVKRFIYLSTACVFPGDSEKMPDEDTMPEPKHWYGWTKLLGEEIVRSHNSNHFHTTVIRTNYTSMPWQYPKAFTDRFGTYLFDIGVVQGILDVLKIKPNLPVVHICGRDRLSMYDYAVLGGSKVDKMTLDDYHGPELTKDMCITSKYWKLYDIKDNKPFKK